MIQHFFGLLHRNNLSPNDYCVLWNCTHGVSCSTKIFDLQGIICFLQANRYLDKDHKPTDRAMELIRDVDKLFRKTKVTGDNETLGDGYLEQVKAYRAKFPAGKKASDDEVRDKIAKLFLKVPDLNWDIIQTATDLYLGMLSDTQYCMKAGNFIENSANKSQTIMEYIERVMSGEISYGAGNVTGLTMAA